MKVVVGMSGGVDSSVSALLLKEQGYEVVGATMRLLNNSATDKMISDAKEVCNQLGIKHYVFDFSSEFNDIVIKDFMDKYNNCLTPNPCVVCNKQFKFKRFYKEALKLGADLISTGHYVNVRNGMLIKSAADKKDQTYFLWNIDKEVLNHVIFPLALFKSKDEIRRIAKEHDLIVASKKDSQDICFIEKDYTDFLKHNLSKLPDEGNIRHINGEILGKHKGLFYYTIGQRKGLNISYKTPLFVLGFDKIKNELIVGDNKDLFKDKLLATDINLLVDELPTEVYCKIRSRSDASKATIKYVGKNIEVTFAEPVRAITPGQSAVFYKDDVCLGGGYIENID